MRPVINLYQPPVQKAADLLSAKNIFMVYAGVMLVFIGISGYGVWQNGQLEIQVQKEEARKAQAEQEVANMQVQHSDESQILKLTEEVVAIEQERDLKKQVVQMLSDRTLSNSEGFSSYLVSLARQSQSGFWFEKIKISQGGANLELEGKTLQPEFLFRYLQRLRNESNFTGKSFNTFSLTKSTEGETLNFFLSSAQKEEEQTSPAVSEEEEVSNETPSP